jgi:fumarate reductase subunit D
MLRTESAPKMTHSAPLPVVLVPPIVIFALTLTASIARMPCKALSGNIFAFGSNDSLTMRIVALVLMTIFPVRLANHNPKSAKLALVATGR